MPKIKLSPFLKNILMTTITSLITITSMIFIIRFLAKGFGPEEFGAYSLARRVISNSAPLVILSMDVALSRYIAMNDERRLQGSYIISSILLVAAAMFLFLIIATSASNYLSHLIFHSNEYLNLYYASLFLLGGYCICVITSACLFGMQKIDKANLLRLFLMAILPLIIAYTFGNTKSPAFVVFLMGSVFYISLFPLILIVIKTAWPGLSQLKASIKTIIRYGIPRAPAGFALAGLLTLGPFLASYFGDLKDAGFFVVGQSVFRVMESTIVAFGLVALPKVAQLFARGKEEFLKTNVENILVMIFQLGLFVAIHTFLWSREIVLIWLGPEYLEAVVIMRILIISLGPYLGYVMLRSVVDAIGTTIGFAFLGILTGYYLMKRYLILYNNFMLRSILLLNFILAGIALIIKKYIIATSFSQYSLLVSGFILEVLVFSGYLFWLYKKDIGWVLEIKNRIIYAGRPDNETING
jgi:O-antigen/teichoic acid export membrane protein